ncbi:MAG: translation initiation factor IF-1 [Parcubacteria group bacterium]
MPEAPKRSDVIELKGVIIEVLPNAQYRVRLEGGQEVLTHLAGRMRLNRIRVLNGDGVTVQMSPYDLTKGRIVRRER